MAITYQALASTTVGAGGASSITFSSIPSTFTDLNLKISANTTNSGALSAIIIKFNGSSTGYSDKSFRGFGSGISTTNNIGGGVAGYAGQARGQDVSSSGWTSPIIHGSVDLYISNYAGSQYKQFLMDSIVENNAEYSGDWLTINQWADTSAITSMVLTAQDGSNFKQYSTFTLYGIKNS